jgi:hypothetical protein
MMRGREEERKGKGRDRTEIMGKGGRDEEGTSGNDEGKGGREKEMTGMIMIRGSEEGRRVDQGSNGERKGGRKESGTAWQ